MNRLVVRVLMLSSMALLTSATAATPTPAASSSGTAQTLSPKPFSHVFVFVLENHGYRSIIGNPQLPIINKLAQSGALARQYHGVAHPSLPNYVALIGGATGGSHSNSTSQKFYGPTLPDRLEAAGLTWKGYFQGMPSAGFQGPYSGKWLNYAKKHNPFMLFPAIATRPERAKNSVPLAQLAADLSHNAAPNYAMVVPDLCHDMHGAPNCLNRAQLYKAADQFVGQWVSAVQRSSAWDDNAAIVITFDEAEGSDTTLGGGRIPTIVLTRTGPQGVVSDTTYTHYNLLRTLTDAWKLAPLGESQNVAPMNELFWK